MKHVLIIPVFLIFCLFAADARAQQADPARGLNRAAGEQKKDTTAKKRKLYPVVLGYSELSGGGIGKTTFDSLMRQGLKAGDSARVSGFVFNYMERNIYEDSIGNIIPVTDLFTEYCPGDTLAPTISNSIYLRTKRGDTAFFDNIKLIRSADGREVPGRSMKFVIE